MLSYLVVNLFDISKDVETFFFLLAMPKNDEGMNYPVNG